ncbi:MAG: hypothetical protein ABFR95_08890 [Actinomycetota bacterium]
MTVQGTTDEAVIHQNEAVGSTAAASDEDAARSLLAEARYDAFTLVTEARKEAEGILDQARAEAAGIIRAAEVAAEATTARAVEDAETIREQASEQAAASPYVEAPTAAGEESTEPTEPASELKDVASDIEHRFEALASKDTPAHQETPRPMKASVERDSFYNRRSAKLPRIGVEAGRQVVGMTRSMRQSIETD